MSGKKRTQVDLNQVADLIVKVQHEKSSTIKKIDELMGKIDGLLTRVKNQRISDRNMAGRLVEYKEQLIKETAKAFKRREDLMKINVPDSIINVNTSSLEKTRGKIGIINGGTREAINFLNQIEIDMINMSVADKALSSNVYKTENLQDQLKSQEELLMKWTKNDFAQINRDFSSLEEKIGGYRRSASGNITTEIISNFKAIEAALDELQERLAGLLRKANKKEELQQRRTYILKGLRQVCADLGFKEVEGVKYQAKDDLSSDILLTLDTMKKKLTLNAKEEPTEKINFKLHLDNSIESDSDINIGACESQFEKISEELLSRYGAQATFKKINVEEVPIIKTNAAKPLPRQQSQTMQRQ